MQTAPTSIARSAIRFFLACSIILLGGTIAAAHACEPLRQAQEALALNDPLRAEAAAATALDQGCSGPETDLAARYAALAYYNQAVAPIFAGEAALQDQAPLIRQARVLAAPWQVLEAVGELAKEERDYAAASDNFHAALEDALIEEKNPGALAATEEDLARLEQAAAEIRLAAPQVLAPKSAKSARPCTLRSRSYGVQRRAEPIRFAFASDTLEGEDLKAAGFLFACLKHSGAKEVEVVGHTDDVGERDFNQALSERRAEAVAAYLSERGYAGQVTTSGRGEDEPFEVADESFYPSKAERDRVNRRVEVLIRDY